MATKLVKPVSREVELEDEFGNSGDVIVTMKKDGIEFRMKSTSRKIFMPWQKVIKGMAKLPANAPGRHLDNPLGWLVQK